MTEFELPVHKDRIYLKEELRKILNTDRLRAFADAKTVVLFSEDASLDEIEQSLNIILADVQLRKGNEDEKKG